MKWILIILVLLVVGGVLYARSSRSRPEAPSGRAHRLDDASTAAPAARTEPSPHVRTPPPAVAEDAPGSDFAREPEITPPTDVRDGDDDPLTPGGATTT